MKLKILALAAILLAPPALTFAAPITYPGSAATDSSTGSPVTSGVTATVASVTDLDGNAKPSTLAAAHVAGGNTSTVYDAAANGEAWVTLSLSASGHTFAPVTIFCSSDPSTLAQANTGISGLGTTLTGTGVKIGSYASGQDPYSLLMAGSFLTIPGDHTTSGQPVTLTYKQMLAISLAVPASDNSSTVPAPGSTAATSYYLAGQPAVPGNLVYIGTVTYNAAGIPVGRTVKIASPFPAVN